MKPILLGTGLIVAMLDRSEHQHASCVRTLNQIDAPLVTCEPVIAEACYFTRSLTGAPDAIVQNVAAGALQIPIPLIAIAQPPFTVSCGNIATTTLISRTRF